MLGNNSNKFLINKSPHLKEHIKRFVCNEKSLFSQTLTYNFIKNNFRANLNME